MSAAIIIVFLFLIIGVVVTLIYTEVIPNPFATDDDNNNDDDNIPRTKYNKVRITRPGNLAESYYENDKHHLHIAEIEVYDNNYKKVKIKCDDPCYSSIYKDNPATNAFDGDYTTYTHSDYGSKEILTADKFQKEDQDIQDHVLAFKFEPTIITHITIWNRSDDVNNISVEERFVGSELELYDVDEKDPIKFTFSQPKGAYDLHLSTSGFTDLAACLNWHADNLTEVYHNDEKILNYEDSKEWDSLDKLSIPNVVSGDTIKFKVKDTGGDGFFHSIIYWKGQKYYSGDDTYTLGETSPEDKELHIVEKTIIPNTYGNWQTTWTALEGSLSKFLWVNEPLVSEDGYNTAEKPTIVEIIWTAP